jgi:hypothetical protein
MKPAVSVLCSALLPSFHHGFTILIDFISCVQVISGQETKVLFLSCPILRLRQCHCFLSCDAFFIETVFFKINKIKIVYSTEQKWFMN